MNVTPCLLYALCLLNGLCVLCGRLVHHRIRSLLAHKLELLVAWLRHINKLLFVPVNFHVGYAVWHCLTLMPGLARFVSRSCYDSQHCSSIKPLYCHLVVT